MYLTRYVLIAFLLRIPRAPAALFLRGLLTQCCLQANRRHETQHFLIHVSNLPAAVTSPMIHARSSRMMALILSALWPSCLQAKALYDDVISRSYSCAVWERKLKDSWKIRCVATGDQHKWRINFLSSNFLRKSLRQTNLTSLSLILPIIYTVLGL